MFVISTLPVLQTSPENATRTSEPVWVTVASQVFDTVSAGVVVALQFAVAGIDETGPLPSAPFPLAIMVSLFEAVADV